MNSNMEKPYVVGIDIGGTNTVFGIVDARGTVIASDSIKTGAYADVETYVDEVCKNLLPRQGQGEGYRCGCAQRQLLYGYH